MKRQLDRLKGKRLVTGDPNLMTKDEICINATPNGVEVKEIGTDGKIKDLAGSSNNGGGGIGDNEEVWYIIKRDVNDPLSNDTLDTLSNISNSLCLIEAYIEWYNLGGVSLTKKSISNYKNENGGYRIEAFRITPSYVFIGNGFYYFDVQNIESLFKEYLKLATGGQIPPEMEEEVNNAINTLIEDINRLYYTGTKQEMIAHLESIYNN